MKKYLMFFVLMFMMSFSIVFASEIAPLKFAGFSDNSSASMRYSIETSDGGIAGIAEVGGDEFGLNFSSSYVRALVKLDSNLEVEWAYSLESSSYSFTDIIEDENNNFILVGSEFCTAKYYTYYKSAFLFINSHGEKVKEVEIKTNSQGIDLNSLISDGEYYYSIGSQQNTTILSEDSSYYYTRVDVEYGLYKFDSNFNLVWFNKIYDSNYKSQYGKYANGFSSSVSRNSFIDFTSEGDIVFSYNCSKDVTIYKYDKNGNQIYKKDLGSNEFSTSYYSGYVTSLVATEDNGVVAVGTVYSTETKNNDAFYLKLDRDGNVEWIKYLIDNDNDYMYGVSRYNDDYVMVGKTSATLENTDITGSFMMIVNDSGETLVARSVEDDLTTYNYSEPLLVVDSKIYFFGRANNKYSHYSDINKYTNAIGCYSVKYDITVKDEEGKISLSVQESAFAGDVVQVDININDDYVFKGIKDIELVKVDDDTYSFVMPDADTLLVPIIEEKVDDVIDNVDNDKDEIKNPNTIGFLITTLMSSFVIGTLFLIMSYKKLKWLK